MVCLKIHIPLLWITSILFFNLVYSQKVHSPPVIQVLSPSEINIILPPEDDGKLRRFAMSINNPFGFNLHDADFTIDHVDGGFIHFSNKSMHIKKGDTIYYAALYRDSNEGAYGQAGTYDFDGVYKNKTRSRREIYELSSEESSEDDVHQRIGTNHHSRQHRHEHDHNPNGHFHAHGPPHGHFGPHHFAPPPFGFGHPPYPGPGKSPYNYFGPHYPGFRSNIFKPFWYPGPYDRKDRFGGGDRPWDNDGNCGSHGHGKYPGGQHEYDNKKPWGDGNRDNPYSGSGNNNGKDGNDDSYGEKKPGKGNSFGNSNNSGGMGFNGNDRNGDDKNNKGTENPYSEVFTTKKPSSTTQRTTITPDIDIRFRVPEER